MTQPIAPLNLDDLRRRLSGNGVWIAAAVLVLMIFVLKTIRIENISGEQTAFLLNKITGNIQVIDRSGKQIFNGLTKEFYVIEKTLQTIEMTEQVGRGDRDERDDLKVKTIDGSDVYVDLKVQYRIDTNMARDIILTSGPGNMYKEKWARDYIRSISRNFLGELTTEEFYDSAKRDAKVDRARAECNVRLSRFGIHIDQIVIPRRPHFYADYEEMIKKKKEADQTVHAEHSKALAAKQKQETLTVKETNIKNVRVEEFTGKMQQKIIAANAGAEKFKKHAEGYYEQKTIAAEAEFYKLEKRAEAITAQKAAEAAGIKALRMALEGPGGANMVKLEYARRLAKMAIIGKPFSVEGTIERFEHLRGAETIGVPAK
ncbi:MAG: SPFH domain-containing protein [Lentisphaerae bacterium]|nr:SPFH domain-containing protein [Lentisphaerota bacterium]